MVKEIKWLFQCEECKLFYRDREIAEKCELHCKKYKACDIEIIKQAVNNP